MGELEAARWEGFLSSPTSIAPTTSISSLGSDPPAPAPSLALPLPLPLPSPALLGSFHSLILRGRIVPVGSRCRARQP